MRYWNKACKQSPTQEGEYKCSCKIKLHFFLRSASLVQRMLRAMKRLNASIMHQYLGNFQALFNFNIEELIPSWNALEWILEDVGLWRQINMRPKEAHDMVYRKICHSWSKTPPVTVTNDSRFCDCPRRWKWSPQASINNLEFNWPINLGSFQTPKDCHESYMHFSYAHREHQDHVCYRAAIFTAILAFWCQKYELCVSICWARLIGRRCSWQGLITIRRDGTDAWRPCVQHTSSLVLIILWWMSSARHATESSIVHWRINT